MDEPKEFRRLKREFATFKKFLATFEIPTREEEIKRSYLYRLNALQIFPTERESNEEIPLTAPETEIGEMLQEIRDHPEKTKFLLLKIMQLFPLQEHDREVLADTFSQLPYPELEKSVLDLKKSIG